MLVKGILEDYSGNYRQSLVKQMGPALGTICTEFHETLSISDETTRNSSLESGEMLQIQNTVADQFQNRVALPPGMDLQDTILNDVLDKWFPDAIDSTATTPLNSTDAVLAAAEETAAFNKKMKAWFANYDAENDYQESDHTPVPGHFL